MSESCAYILHEHTLSCLSVHWVRLDCIRRWVRPTRMTASKKYPALVDAMNAQLAQIHGEAPQGDLWGGPMARRSHYDPHEALDTNLEIIRSYIQP